MKTKGRTTYRVAEASVQSDEVEGDGSVAAVDLEDPWHARGPAWGGMRVRWRVEVRTLLPSVQAEAYLGARWLVAEAREGEEVRLEEEDREDPAGGGRGRAVEVCKVQEVAGGRGVQEGGAGHGVQGRGEDLGPWGPENPWSETLWRIQVPEKYDNEKKKIIIENNWSCSEKIHKPHDLQNVLKSHDQ